MDRALKYKTIVITENEQQFEDMCELFMDLLKPNAIRMAQTKDSCRIETSKHYIEIIKGAKTSMRGYRCDYLLNLVQDKQFHYEVALPMLRAKTIRQQMREEYEKEKGKC
jgi:hypothetical protein